MYIAYLFLFLLLLEDFSYLSFQILELFNPGLNGVRWNDAMPNLIFPGAVLDGSFEHLAIGLPNQRHGPDRESDGLDFMKNETNLTGTSCLHEPFAQRDEGTGQVEKACRS